MVVKSYSMRRFGPSSTFRDSRTLLRSLRQSGRDEQAQTLWILPNSPASSEQVISFVQSWAQGEAEEGPAVQVEVTENGVIFSFKASPASYLALDVVTSEDNSVRINSRSVVETDEDKPSVSSLIGVVAQSLIDSLCHDISDIVMDQSSGTATNEVKEEVQRDDFIEAEVSQPSSRPSMSEEEVAIASFQNQLEYFSPINSMLASDIDTEYVSDAMNRLATEIKTGFPSSSSSSSWGGIAVANWSQLAISQETVVTNFIRSWADQRFAGRGAGIEARDVPFGVKLSFAISNSLTMTLKVLCAYGAIDRIDNMSVVALLVHNREEEEEEDDDDEEEDREDNDDSIQIPSGELNLVSLAAKNIVRAMHTDLKSLFLEPAPTHNDNDGSGSSHSDGGSDLEVIAGEKPVLGDLPGSNEAIKAMLSASSLDGGAGAGAEREGKEGNGFVQRPDVRSLLKEQQSQRKKEGETGSRSGSGSSSSGGGNNNTSGIINNPQSGSDSGGSGAAKANNVDSGDGDDVQPGILSRKKKTSSLSPQRLRDPAVMQKAAHAGVKLESFEGKGVEQQALDELQQMMANKDNEGFLSVLKTHKQQQQEEQERERGASKSPQWQQRGGKRRDGAVDVNLDNDLKELMQAGAALSVEAAQRLEDKLVQKAQGQGQGDKEKDGGETKAPSPAQAAAALLSRPKGRYGDEDLSRPGTAFPMDLERAGFLVR